MRRNAWILVLCLALAGCGATRSSPDNVTTMGGLTPNVEDEAGLVAVAPGFEITKYPVIVVEKLPVAPSEIEDDGDRRFAEKMTDHLHRELVRRLRESGTFQRVVDAGETPAPSVEGAALRLRGTITRLGRGSQAARAFAGLYGAGRARAQVETQLVDVASNRVVVAVADRRVSSYNPWTFGGSDEANLEECFEDTARDLAAYFRRLAKAPPK